MGGGNQRKTATGLLDNRATTLKEVLQTHIIGAATIPETSRLPGTPTHSTSTDY